MLTKNYGTVPVMQSRPQTSRPRPDNFSETKTEIETGKFRGLRFETETRNNRDRDRDRDQKILRKYSRFNYFKNHKFLFSKQQSKINF